MALVSLMVTDCERVKSEILLCEAKSVWSRDFDVGWVKGVGCKGAASIIFAVMDNYQQN